MTFTIALILAAVCVVLAFIVDSAAILLLLLAAVLLVLFALPSFPWLAVAAATWLLIQLVAGLKAAASAARRPTPTQ